MSAYSEQKLLKLASVEVYLGRLRGLHHISNKDLYRRFKSTPSYIRSMNLMAFTAKITVIIFYKK